MPMYKRKPFPLLETPKDLKPQEFVYQVRFTKEIFRDYREYLNRINFYRQRVWTCKVSGKSNLTFEEALVSEKKATEKVQQFPNELLGPVLQDVQFSMLTLKALVTTIAKKLQEPLLEGIELLGKRNNRVYPCKILKVLDVDGKAEYEVEWLDKDKKTVANDIVNEEVLIRRKLPFTRDVLKSFIRESTYRSGPWVIHDNLAKKYGISSHPPQELKHIVSLKEGKIVNSKKDGKHENGDFRICNRKRSLKECLENEEEKEPIKYPIDDLLVKPAEDDPIFSERPIPSRDFSVPIDIVGDLLMVWDFCSSFGRLLNLLPFSLAHVESAICHKESNVVMIVEIHAAFLRLLMKDNGDYKMIIEKKKRKAKITLVTWTEYLCDFLEVADISDSSKVISTIKRGHYGLLEINTKLEILGELVNQVFISNTFRVNMDECIEQRQALGSEKRGEALEEGRKRREEKQRLKAGPNDKTPLESLENSSNDLIVQNGDAEAKENRGKTVSQNGKRQKVESTSNGQKIKQKAVSVNKKDLSNKDSTKLKIDNGKEDNAKSIEQRKEYFEREMEKIIIRTTPLGKDRDYNRYWFFRRDGRLFVESSDSKQWGYYSTKDELEALMGSLNRKGERERALKLQLEKYYSKICSEMQKRLKEAASNSAADESVLRKSTRVRAPPRDNPALAFLKYVNRWRED
ncbi:DDT domain-containing protein DDB_G0282237 [Impatiens glandulifera]|uniref:DDT domain-containing protein DDB_G0282237 n=1 Tax=Impatiens glandulifera TaxID=253017 RepID=UPI001FB0EC64|nr:DDT domain-containing protein DDB_G0282237 [Impatiens glandulifera]